MSEAVERALIAVSVIFCVITVIVLWNF